MLCIFMSRGWVRVFQMFWLGLWSKTSKKIKIHATSGHRIELKKYFRWRHLSQLLKFPLGFNCKNLPLQIRIRPNLSSWKTIEILMLPMFNLTHSNFERFLILSIPLLHTYLCTIYYVRIAVSHTILVWLSQRYICTFSFPKLKSDTEVHWIVG